MVARTSPSREESAAEQMAALELRYQQTQDSLTEARALYADSGAALADDPAARRSRARVQKLQAQLAELQRAMEELEDGLQG